MGRIVSWAWAPGGTALYTLTWDGHLARHRIPGGEAETIWQPPVPGIRLPAGYDWRFGGLSVSPNGRWFALHASAHSESERTLWFGLQVMLTISSDGSRAIPIARTNAGRPIWSSNGRYLYLVQFDSNHLAVGRWQEGAAEARPLLRRPNLGVQQVEALPRGSGLLVWGQQQVFTMDPQGRLHPVSNPDLDRFLAHGTQFVGFDDQGRMMVRNHFHSSGRLEAVDLATWTMKDIYP